VIETIAKKFDSGNSVPVDRAVVTREEFEALMEERNRLRELVAIAYQVCGAADAPERILDALISFGEGVDLDTLLPVTMQEFAWFKDIERPGALVRAAYEEGYSDFEDSMFQSDTNSQDGWYRSDARKVLRKEGLG